MNNPRQPRLNHKTLADPKLVDEQCVALAEHFCRDDPQYGTHVVALSEAIQDAVELFLMDLDYELANSREDKAE